MIDAYVRWAHLKEDGTPVIDAAGVIVALEKSSGTWNALILKYDGTFVQANPADLIVIKMPENRLDFESFHLGVSPDLRFGSNDAAESQALDNLETYLDGKFPGLDYGGGPIERVQAMLDSMANLIDYVSTEFQQFSRNEGEQPGDHVVRLLREIVTETSALVDKKNADVAALKSELAALKKKHRPKGPKGPGEEPTEEQKPEEPKS